MSDTAPDLLQTMLTIPHFHAQNFDMPLCWLRLFILLLTELASDILCFKISSK